MDLSHVGFFIIRDYNVSLGRDLIVKYLRRDFIVKSLRQNFIVKSLRKDFILDPARRNFKSLMKGVCLSLSEESLSPSD